MALRILLACIEVNPEVSCIFIVIMTIHQFSLFCLQSHAIRHKRYIVPVISVHMDFYIRVFVRIFTLSPPSAFPWYIFSLWDYNIFNMVSYLTNVSLSLCRSASTVKSSPLKFSHVYQCVGCSSFHLQKVGRINSKVDCSFLVSLSCMACLWTWSSDPG
jgi:tRNA G26 N,N-dimethylase Trm1